MTRTAYPQEKRALNNSESGICVTTKLPAHEAGAPIIVGRNKCAECSGGLLQVLDQRRAAALDALRQRALDEGIDLAVEHG